jgi:hypothetical protein
MRLHYFFRYLSKSERELMEQVLLEEMQVQSWYSLVWIDFMGGETIIPLQ